MQSVKSGLSDPISSTEYSIAQPGANLLIERLPVALRFFVFGAQLAVRDPIGIIQQQHIHLHEHKVSEQNSCSVGGLIGPQPRAILMESCPTSAATVMVKPPTINY